MKTDELIERFANNLQPVRPLAPPGTRTALWLLAAAAYLLVSLGMIAIGLVPGGAVAEPIYVLQQGLALATGVAAAFAAFTSVIPGLRRGASVFVGVSASAWLGMVLWTCVRDLRTHGTFGITSQTDWPCVAVMVVGGGVLWAAMAPMLRRGVPLASRRTELLSGVAALSIANVAACLAGPHAFGSIVLLWHGGTLALMLALLVAVGDRVICWPPPSRP